MKHPMHLPAPTPLTRRRALATLAGAALVPLALPGRARAAGPAFEVIHEFTGGSGGAYPASLMFRSDGVLYGVTESGGRASRGTIFRVADGRFRVAHAFISGEAQPGGVDTGQVDPLVEGPDGALYGTTFNGGNFQKGLAYRLYGDTDTLMQLHHFTGGEADGMSPNEQLTVGADGALYGTGVRVVGGWNQVPQAYRLTVDGSVTQLAQIGTWLNGLGKLTLASDGNFYTMSMLGGAFGHGGAYRMAPGGTLALLYSVAFERPSMSPTGGFVQHANGLLYGTTENDPEGRQLGTVFRMTLDGRVKILHRFSGTDGSRPFGLVTGPDGALYGVARQGGPTGFGAVYRIDTRGNLTVLHAFESFVSPVGRLAFGPDGRLYGVTQFGPTQPYGSVYALALPAAS